jgi:hypothetical protein
VEGYKKLFEILTLNPELKKHDMIWLVKWYQTHNRGSKGPQFWINYLKWFETQSASSS